MESQIIKFVCVTLLLLLPQNLHAVQFGGGFGDATDESAATQQVQTERQERGGSITIAWSENNDELSGFSNKTGRWQKLKIEPLEKIQPNCVEFVGAVRLTNGIAAYSGETGTWDVVHLPETSTAMPAVSPDVAQFKEGEHFYAFSAATGRWTSPTDPAMKTLTIHYLSPKHMSAAELHARLIDWMQTVPASEVNGSIQWLDGVLSLLPRTKEWHEAAEAEIAKLDVPGAEAAGPGLAGYGGSSGGGFSVGGFGAGGGAGFGSAREVSSNGLIITWSENHDEIRGFSNSKGEWDVLEVEKQQQIVPVVGDDVAAVRLGNSMAAFSATLAQWDVIPLSDGSTAFPVVHEDYVRVEDNGHLYTFADAKGQWTSPTDPEFQRATAVVSLGNKSEGSDQQAFDKFGEWHNSLPRYKARGISLNVTSQRATILASRRSWFAETKAKLNEINEMIESATDFSVQDATSPQRHSTQNTAQIESDITKLRIELAALDAAARKGIVENSEDTKEEQLEGLREVVVQAFDRRQKLQRLEAQRMKLKLQLIETNLDAREKAREAIIERRMSELRSGDSRQPVQTQKRNQPAAKSVLGSPISGTPIGLAGPPHIPIGGPAGLDSGSSRRSNSDDRIQWAQPAEIVKDLRKCRSDLTSLQSQAEEPERQVKLWSQSFEILESEGYFKTVSDPKVYRESNLDHWTRKLAPLQDRINNVKKDWRYVWSAYQSKLRLLKLNVEEAKASQDALQERSNTIELMDRQAEASNSDLLKAQMIDLRTQIPIAKINLQRAEELLKLYADIETQEPDLNPDSLNPEK